jgi:ketopantoate reductase
VIVATKHHQAAQAIQQCLPDAPRATFLLFTANWYGTEEIAFCGDPQSLRVCRRLMVSMLAASSCILIATVNSAVRLGMFEGFDPNNFKVVTELFSYYPWYQPKVP